MVCEAGDAGIIHHFFPNEDTNLNIQGELPGAQGGGPGLTTASPTFSAAAPQGAESVNDCPSPNTHELGPSIVP